MTENYVFDNAVTAETGMRFSGLEATFDPRALDEAIAYLADPTSIISMPTTVSAWGRQQ